ncbi:hypothetical protein M4D81_13530 [Paenibacillus sp. p3-SID867]|uniref:hypothetical protein n=1 Tax=Paenibacillus sp. p3-SID867 TaxID=2916363 RepID=UPI0021A67E04|nr:hypothetical protein [Paenibacillus sp. p3-SID867]MCT1400047.1 hypothetical protein [Paenibacillus sp. p3-SID867]
MTQESNKVTNATIITACGMLGGGGLGAGIGSLIFPGPGTAIGYLMGVGIGVIASQKFNDR